MFKRSDSLANLDPEIWQQVINENKRQEELMRINTPLFVFAGVVATAIVAGRYIPYTQRVVEIAVSKIDEELTAEAPGSSGTYAISSSISPSQIHVYDGDTIIIAHQRMRLLDIDTPEISRPRCAAEKTRGYQARDRLRTLVANAERIEVADSGQRDRYERPLIHLVIDGQDTGSLLVSEGHAVPWRPGRQAWEERRQHWCGYTTVE